MMEKLELKYNAIESGIEYIADNNTEIILSKQNKFMTILMVLKNLIFKPKNQYQN